MELSKYSNILNSLSLFLITSFTIQLFGNTVICLMILFRERVEQEEKGQ